MPLNRQTCRALAAALLLVGAAHSRAQDSTSSGEWQFGLDTYVWAPSLGGTTTSGNDIDVGFSDLLENLDMFLMAGLRASKNKWRLAGDLIYLDIDADNGENFNVPVGPFLLPLEVDAKVVLKGWIVTAGAGYNLVDNEKWSLDLIGGARYLWLDATFTLDEKTRRLPRTIKLSGSAGTWDGIVGVDGKVRFDDRWYLRYYGDIGTGDSDLTWAAQGILGYRFKKFDAYAGYRHMEWDGLNNRVIDDLDLSGPIIGARFTF